MNEICCLIKESGEGCTFNIHVTPRASRAEIIGLQDQALKIKVTALPVEGAANAACLKLLAQELGLKKSLLQIRTGNKSRHKKVIVKNVSKMELAMMINSTLKR